MQSRADPLHIGVGCPTLVPGEQALFAPAALLRDQVRDVPQDTCSSTLVGGSAQLSSEDRIAPVLFGDRLDSFPRLLTERLENLDTMFVEVCVWWLCLVLGVWCLVFGG